MLFYLIIFLLSVGGIIMIIRRNREEFVSFNFAEFMDGLVDDAAEAWHSHLRERSLTFLEKRLREARIWVLKTESMLFRTASKIRGIKERNGNPENGNGASDEILK
ncbi:hypothetical protein A2661_01200 [Candidatus Giovannonibacteria bacterium RIFCSPHIGHO2_01_FULL_45_24]|uniref:Uncharacterized protein n=1 Tax=Candidatus Giovannonibacteria bacterium RIFCSPLOWO2_01_FULL_46_32 TaxID=1798353 RepID=A0A1F5XHG7_9BACT|nr:MAG: hypothetical protein A2661_01200 [Candidatus Giovannonibacteria bacterium RIFCSPHIGHO2_01_FULL_45_24]OGF87317.1 MAG: hypothetical protein A3B19_03795 [Candidatus Giovannonibacteria bacterium RIFCSPLOWO2_01_FULL_46_32]